MKNWITTILTVFLFLGVQFAQAQAKKKKLPRNINMLGYDNFSPAISGDGNSMVFMSNYTNDESTAMMYTKKVNASSWADPTELPRIINIPHLTYMNGYCLNFDGTEFYFTFKKSGGLGGYDLWKSELGRDGWGAAQNLGSPLNSSLNDGAPSISADGRVLYFMSCESMTNDSASGCMLMMSIRNNTRSNWGKPVPLPNQINQGNTLSPNILADGETLMFMSDYEGVLKWYMARMEGSEWQTPQAMDFLDINAQRKISVAAKGRYVYHDVKGERGSFIEQLLIPANFKPQDILRVIGSVNFDEGGTLKVYDVDTRERIIFEKLAGGDGYDLVLKEGHIYDVSFETTNQKIPAVSRIFDLSEIKFSTREKWDINPQALNIGDSLKLDALSFDTVSLRVTDQSVYELRRLKRFLSKNQESKYDVNIIHYFLDTAVVEVPEMTIDSLEIAESSFVEDTLSSGSDLESDSLMAVTDSVAVQMDSTVYEEEVIVPTLAENLALSLLQELIDDRTSADTCRVNGLTTYLKELEGNEELAGKLVVYLKKRE